STFPGLALTHESQRRDWCSRQLEMGKIDMKVLHFFRLLPAAAVAAVLAQPAAAATKDGSFSIRGFGAQTCAVANASLKEKPEAVNGAVAWLLGYLTALNRINAETFDISPVSDG